VLGSHAKLASNVSGYYLSVDPAGISKKSGGCKVFVKGIIDGFGEDKKAYTGLQIEIAGAVEKMVFSVAGDGILGAAAAAAPTGVSEIDSGITSPADKNTQGGSKSFSFGSLLSKAKKFSISMDSKSPTPSASVFSESEPKPAMTYEPHGGWKSWLRLANRFSCCR
jgi:hypothetical protein